MSAAATVRRVGTCETCRASVVVDAPARLGTPKFLTTLCLVCRWPIVLTEPTEPRRPAVEHALVAGSELWLGFDVRLGAEPDAMRCACGMSARRVAPGTFRCESHLERRRVTVAP